MQELTNIDVDKLNSYQAMDSPPFLNPNHSNYQFPTNKIYPSNNKPIPSPNTSIAKNPHFIVPQKQVSLVESFSLSQPFFHERKGSAILTVRQLKELQAGKVQPNVSRQTVRSQGSSRKIYVSISKSNRDKQKRNSTEQVGRKGKISLTQQSGSKREHKNHPYC